MNRKLVLFLVLLCLAPLPAPSSGFKLTFGKFGKLLGVVINAIEAVPLLCEAWKILSSHNCSIGSPAMIAGSDDTNTEVDLSYGTYLLNPNVGSKEQSVSLIIDTTLDLTFMLCKPCGENCSTNINVYDPTGSNTFSNYTCDSSECLNSVLYSKCSDESCVYNYSGYAYSTSQGFLSNDTFYFDDTPHPIVFGCGVENTGNYGDSIGYVGLGLGNLSLPHQLGYSNFSYCFSSDSGSAIFFGSDIPFTSAANSTQLFLSAPLYYINLTGIIVGGKHVDIQTNYAGVTVLASAFDITFLEESLYYSMKEELKKQINLPEANRTDSSHLDLCFDLPAEGDVAIPPLTLQFDGADMNPNPNFYLYSDTVNSVLCLLVLPTKDISILGNMMQKDMHVIYDISNFKLQFESVNCSSLRSSGASHQGLDG